MLDEQLIAEAKVPGLRPTQQQRSRELVVRLVNEGLALLEEHDFDTLSVEALCARCSATVGSFYARFDSKDAFIEAVQQLVVEDRRRDLAARYASDRVPRHDLARLIDWISKGAVVWYQRYRGLIRASLRRAGNDHGSWTPMRDLGRMQVEYCLPIMVELMGGQATPELEQRIRFAFQLMYGTLNNMILINPGPLTLQDPATPRLLATAMLRLIDPGRT